MQSSTLYRLAQNDAQLNNLVLNGSCMGTRGAMQLASALRNNSNLLSLRMPMNFIGSEGLEHLVSFLTDRRCPLVELDLSDNDLGDEGCAILSEVLKFNRSIHTLKLADNDISDVGLSEIVQSLRSNTTLRHLNLSGNQISDQGVEALCNILPESSLKTLDLSSNRIADGGAVSVAMLLTSNIVGLENVQLDNNRIGESGVTELRSCMRRTSNPHLQLSFGKVPRMDACAFA